MQAQPTTCLITKQSQKSLADSLPQPVMSQLSYNEHRCMYKPLREEKRSHQAQDTVHCVEYVPGHL